jgi:hypothetical protein
MIMNLRKVNRKVLFILKKENKVKKMKLLITLLTVILGTVLLGEQSEATSEEVAIQTNNAEVIDFSDSFTKK